MTQNSTGMPIFRSWKIDRVTDLSLAPEAILTDQPYPHLRLLKPHRFLPVLAFFWFALHTNIIAVRSPFFQYRQFIDTMGCFCSKDSNASSTAAVRSRVDNDPGLVSGAGRYSERVPGRKPRYYNPFTGSEHTSDDSAT
ncbi:hypothetical protein BHE90_005112 [Fusarium euwallaceae]|uniref:Uncharacterized protein n=1 Tax=Fusarium euwallaceae TaxID=1147111 RepID=A0A430LXI7_9HYPO|nr:hypothetical protein BHE90_005112 [Fusarium euwallaceae]